MSDISASCKPLRCSQRKSFSFRLSCGWRRTLAGVKDFLGIGAARSPWICVQNAFYPNWKIDPSSVLFIILTSSGQKILWKVACGPWRQRMWTRWEVIEKLRERRKSMRLKPESISPRDHGRLQEPLGTIKPARLGTGATMGLGAMLHIVHFKEPAGHTQPYAPKHKPSPFLWQTKLSCPASGWQIAGATWYYQTSPTWHWCHLGSGNHPAYCSFSGASRSLPAIGPQTETSARFPGKQK